uniref:DNA damage-binding protein 1 n=1 Tax=Tetradesmus obliquus TaxID=3088 RepID=A0A383VG15_TETOB|eukprot:jgi/Sobl393_1/12730/SZX63614.1
MESMVTDVGPQGCLFNYHVTAHKPTAVRLCAVGSFTSPNETNLIIGRSTHLDIQVLTPEGLKAVQTVPLYGVLSALKLFRPKNATKDLLLLLTEHYKFAVLEWVAAGPSGQPELVTRATCDVKDAIGRPVEAGQLAAVDPECRAIALHLYEGQLKVLQMEEGPSLQMAPETFNLRLEELAVIDMAFLAASSSGSGAGSSAAAAAAAVNPVLALLYEDNKHARHVKTYTLNLKTRELEDGPWSQANVDAGSSRIIPVPQPLGGAIVLGESVLSYFNTQHATRSTQIKPNTSIQSWAAVDADGSRYLLSDHAGGLHLLVLAHADNRVAGLKVQTLGRTTSTHCMAYLDSGYVFLGSKGGDSQLIKLHAEPLPTAGAGAPAGPIPSLAADDDAAAAAAAGSGSAAAAAAAAGGDEGPNHVEVVDSWPSLAPIVDFVVMDLERQGQGQMVTCSGVFQDGSLRVVRNGIGIHEAAAMELPGIKGVWSLRASWMDAFDSHLVLSFVGETRLLAISEEDVLDEASIPGFDGDSQTLLAATTLHDQLLQVTSSAVRLISASSGQLLTQWSPAAAAANAGSSSITLAAASPCQVLVASGGGKVWLLEVTEGGQLQEVGAVVMDAEVACLDITPVGPDNTRAGLAAVGSWSMQVALLSLPDLKPVVTEDLGSEVIPRSVALAEFEGQAYVLCGLGDGQLHNWRWEPESSSLSDHRKVVLGTKPILLSAFSSGGQRHIFAASDRPTIIYSNNRKLLYSNLNENEVAFLASFSTASFPDSLALVKEASLSLGTIDGIQKLHIRTVPLGEQPRRIAHQPGSRSLGVVTISTPAGANPSDIGRSYLRVFSDSSFDLLASYQLGPQEIPTAITSMAFGSSSSSTAAAAAADKAEGAAAVAGGGGSSSEESPSYYIVGTAVIKPNEVEPSKGHILLLHYAPGSNSLTLVEQMEVHGAVYNLCEFQGKLLATVNNKVHLFKWAAAAAGRHELVSDCSPIGVQVLCLFLAVRGDFVVVGDLMNSITLLVYKAAEGALEVRARDQESKWLTALALMDDDTYLAADNSSNMVVVRKNPDAATDEERARLEVVGRFHCGEFVNRLRPGSLVMRLPDSELGAVPSLLYGGVNGSVGLVASLPREWFEMLATLQEGLKKVVRGVGGLDHDSWRRFKDERRSEPASGFIDGDLVEAFADLPPGKGRELVAGLWPGGEFSYEEAFADLPPGKGRELVAGLWPGGEFSYEEVSRRVEELQRLH